MNILFVNNYFPLFANANSGASVRSMRIIKALAKIGNVDVISFVDNEVSNISNVEIVYSNEIGMASIKGNRMNKLFKLFKWTNPYAIYPENKEKSKIIDEIVKQKKYDFIVTRYIHFACDCGLLKYSDRLAIDVDDDPMQAVLMSIPKLGTITNKLYQWFYAHTIDATCRRIICSIRCAFYSTPDMNYVNACFLPNISIFQEPLPVPVFENQTPTVMMVGWFKYYPNIEGLLHFLNKIFPKIKKELPQVTLNIVGKVENEPLRKLCKETEGVNLLGFVENLREQYLRCQCVIVPLYEGTGTSVKLIEAMSLRRSVVATHCGARGLNPAFKTNEDYYLAESDNDFAQKVIYLLTHHSHNIEMANSALKKTQKYYSEAMFNQIIINTLNSSKP